MTKQEQIKQLEIQQNLLRKEILDDYEKQYSYVINYLTSNGFEYDDYEELYFKDIIVGKVSFRIYAMHPEITDDFTIDDYFVKIEDIDSYEAIYDNDEKITNFDDFRKVLEEQEKALKAAKKYRFVYESNTVYPDISSFIAKLLDDIREYGIEKAGEIEVVDHV